MQSKIVYRKMKDSDIANIRSLVTELAQYEKAQSELKTTTKDYESSFQGGVYDAWIAEVDHAVVGMALYYPMFSTWKGKMLYLEDFYVQPQHRGAGIGQRLFDLFIATAKDSSCAGAKWQVLDWNKDAIRFYERNEASIETEWYNGKILF